MKIFIWPIIFLAWCSSMALCSFKTATSLFCFAISNTIRSNGNKFVLDSEVLEKGGINDIIEDFKMQKRTLENYPSILNGTEKKNWDSFLFVKGVRISKARLGKDFCKIFVRLLLPETSTRLLDAAIH